MNFQPRRVGMARPFAPQHAALCTHRFVSLCPPRVTPVFALLLCLLLLAPTLCVAESKPPQTTKPVTTKETSLQRIQKMVAKINLEASTPEGEEAVVNRLSKQLAVTPEALRAEQQMWGIGWGEVAMVYGFSRSSKKKATPAQVVELRRSGMEWDAIGKEIGVNTDAVASRMKKNVKPPAPAPK